MEISEEASNDAGRIAALLALCQHSPALHHHPLVASAIARRDAEEILAHLRRQHVWLRSVYASAFDRDRFESRNFVVIRHAKAAVAVLLQYERLVVA